MSSKTRRAPRSWLWLQGATAGGVVVTAPGTAVLIGVLLAPAIAYTLFETAPNRPTSRTMFVYGSGATFLPIKSLWEHGNGLEEALGLMSDLSIPLMAWMACAGGWMLSECLQLTTSFALKAANRRRLTILQREQDQLIAEWSLPTPNPDR